MAITIGSITTARSTVNDNAPSVAVPAGAAVGDLFVLVWHFIGGSTVTWPAGFTDIGVTAYDANVCQYTKAAIRVCDGTETGSFTGSTPQYQIWEARCVVVKGASATLDAKSANATYQYSSTAAFTGASITTTGASRTILFIAGTEAGGTQAATGTAVPPSGFTTDNSVDRGNGTFTMVAHGSQATAGAATYSGSATFGAVSDSRGSDILVLAFTPSGGNAFTGGVAESMTLSDSGAGATAYQASSTQSVTVSDAAAGSDSGTAASSELASISDARSAAQGVSVAVAESGSAAEATQASLGSAVSAAELVSASDVVSPNSVTMGVVSESAVATDQAVGLSSFTAAMTEVAALNDRADAVAAFMATCEDSADLVEVLGCQLASTASMLEHLDVVDGPAVMGSLLMDVAETAMLYDSFSALLGGISWGLPSPSHWRAPPRTYSVSLPPREEQGADMRRYPNPYSKRSSESVSIDIDASAYLGNGVTITDVHTDSITISPTTAPPLVAANVFTNADPVAINGVAVGAGQALRMTLSGGSTATGVSGRQMYVVRVPCNTSRDSDVIELTIPILVDDYPRFS